MAAWLDFLIGDPWSWLHPVQVIGAIIQAGTQLSLAVARLLPMSELVEKLYLRLVGGIMAWGVICGSGLGGWVMVGGASQLHPGLGFSLAVIIVASCFAGRSLRAAAMDVLTPLAQGHISQARAQLSRYVGRDTDTLEPRDMLRAILETVTENATDGVLAPLFYAGLGCFIPGLGPVPLILAYKAASTLDSMIGYRRPPFADLGWVAAKTEDIFTWLPCRIVVITLILFSQNPHQAWMICARDAPQDPSPNAGWSECAYAVVLGVQVGGENFYQGKPTFKPHLGEPVHEISADTIQAALNLTRRLFLMGLVSFSLLILGQQIPGLDFPVG